MEPQREELSCLTSAHTDHDQKRAAEGYRPEEICHGAEDRGCKRVQTRRFCGVKGRVVFLMEASTMELGLARRELGNPLN